MNFIGRPHEGRKTGNTPTHDHTASPDMMPSFVVRHYDLLWRLLSMGRSEKVHCATLELAGFQREDDLLDIGCGTGTLVLAAEKRFGATGLLVGLDIEPEMIAQAQAKATRQRSTAAFAEGAMTSVPYPDESFDVATSSLMLHHVPEGEHLAGFQELHRVLRPGGRIVVADVNLAQRSPITLVHGRPHSVEDTVHRDVPSHLQAARFREVRTGRHSYKALSYAVGVKAP